MSSRCNTLVVSLAAAILILGASRAQAMPMQGTGPAQSKTKTSGSLDEICGQATQVTAACRKEFEEWQKRENEWRKKRQLYANYISYQGEIVYSKRPDLPSWIPRYCDPEGEDSAAARWTGICLAYQDYLRYDWTQHIEGPPVPVAFTSRVQVGSGESRGFINYLLKNMHYDGPWTNSENGARSYGVFGTHLTLLHAGRLHLWGPPGVLVVRRPGGQMEVRMTWGVDIFVADVPIGRDLRLPVYFTIAKAFTTGGAGTTDSQLNAGMNMVGFSFTVRR